MSKNTYVLLVASVTACGGLLFGFDVGVISGALLYFGPEFQLEDLGKEFVTSAVLVGSFIGALSAGWLIRRFGGQRSNFIAGCIFIVGALASAFAPDPESLAAARVLVGLGVGVTAVAAPLYVAEIAPADRRGLMITLFQLFITIGIVLSYLVDVVAAPHWRVMFGIGAVPGVVLAVGMLFLPQSPRWLIARGRHAEARTVLLKTMDQADVDIVLSEAQREADTQQNASGGWHVFKQRAARRALFITTTLAVFQQLIGINSVIYYAPSIFKAAGFHGDSSALWATFAVGVVNVLATFITIRYVDKAGRRTLLIAGLVGMTIALSVLGLAFHFTTSGATSETLAWTTLGCVMLYIACFAFSMGPLVWVLIGEMFPQRARGPGNAIAVGGNYAANFLVGVTFLSLLAFAGPAITFFLFAGAAILNLLFVYFYVPETAGRSLEEIERELQGDEPA